MNCSIVESKLVKPGPFCSRIREETIKPAPQRTRPAGCCCPHLLLCRWLSFTNYLHTNPAVWMRGDLLGRFGNEPDASQVLREQGYLPYHQHNNVCRHIASGQGCCQTVHILTGTAWVLMSETQPASKPLAWVELQVQPEMHVMFAVPMPS